VTEVETDEAQSTTAPWWHSPRAWAQLALFVLLVAVTGYLLIGLIGDSDDKASPPATTTTTITPEAEVESAYRAFIDMVKRLTAAPDPGDPEIAQRATGEVRTNFEKALTDLQAKGDVIRGGPEDSQRVLSTAIDGDTATLSVCYVDHSGEYNAATGAEVQPMLIFTNLDTVTMVREDGVWRVSTETSAAGATQEGVHDCAT
jgi:hypothetical protein